MVDDDEFHVRGRQGPAVHAEGVEKHSPGSRRIAAHPGYGSKTTITLKGLVWSFDLRHVKADTPMQTDVTTRLAGLAVLSATENERALRGRRDARPSLESGSRAHRDTLRRRLPERWPPP